MELLVEVASHGENTGFEVPCLIVATKDDLHTSAVAVQGSIRVSEFILLQFLSLVQHDFRSNA